MHLCLLTFKIATILILEYATIHFASPSCPTRQEALNEAFSLFSRSDIHNEVNQLFELPPQLYSTRQFTEFILKRRLC